MKHVAPPPKYKLNDQNIVVIEKAVLNGYKTCNSTKNLYAALQNYHGKYYTIMHDWIQKFSKELNGVFIRTVNCNEESSLYEIGNIPWGLLKEAP